MDRMEDYRAYTVTCPACAGSGRGESVTLGDPSCPVCAGARQVEVVPASQLAGAVDAAWTLNDALVGELRRTNDDPDPERLWKAVEAWQSVAPERGR